MLRQGPAQRRARRLDLHLRVHLLCGLCPHPSGRRLPQLRRRSGQAPDAPRAPAAEVPAFDQACAQGSRSLPASGVVGGIVGGNVQYISTRHGSQGEPAALGFEEVMLAGLARDGGLYLPAEWPHFTKAEIANLRDLSYAEL